MDEGAIELTGGRRNLDALTTLLAAPAFLYAGAMLLPRGIHCPALAEEAIRCAAAPVRFFPSDALYRFDLETQAMLALVSFGLAGGFFERLLSHGRFPDRESDRALTRAEKLFSQLAHIAVAAVAGLLASLVPSSLLIDSAVSYAQVNMGTLATLAFMAGFGAPRLIPDFVYRFVPGSLAQGGAGGARIAATARGDDDAAFAMKQLAARLDSIFDQPTLDNWSGRVGVRPESGEWMSAGREERFAVHEGEGIRLRVVFTPATCVDLTPPAISEIIDIGDGNPTPDAVSFSVALDGRGFDPLAPDARGTVEASQSGPAEILVGTGPMTRGSHDIIVEITQKGRLIQTLLVPVLVPAPVPQA